MIYICEFRSLKKFSTSVQQRAFHKVLRLKQTFKGYSIIPQKSSTRSTVCVGVESSILQRKRVFDCWVCSPYDSKSSVSLLIKSFTDFGDLPKSPPINFIPVTVKRNPNQLISAIGFDLPKLYLYTVR